MINSTVQIAHVDNSNKVNKRNWSHYNEELVLRGKLYFDFDFRLKWDDELAKMNRNKVGAPYRFPESFIKLMTILHQFIDYRGLESMARSKIFSTYFQ